MKDKAIINDFLVKVFNEILKHEQIALEGYSKNLSIREMHVIEAVFDGEKEGGKGVFFRYALFSLFALDFGVSRLM